MKNNKIVIRKSLILVFVVGLISVLATSAIAAIPAYLWIDGIDGSVERQGREGSIEVLAFNHEVYQTVDTSSAGGSRVSGDRKHMAFTIVKEFDKSSPKLYEALVTNQPIPSIELKWYRLDPGTRMEETYFTHLLENVVITSVKPWMPNTLNPANQQFRHMEEVSFIYEKITWTWLPDSISTQDDTRTTRS